jgi:hypothetical protein
MPQVQIAALLCAGTKVFIAVFSTLLESRIIPHDNHPG